MHIANLKNSDDATFIFWKEHLFVQEKKTTLIEK